MPVWITLACFVAFAVSCLAFAREAFETAYGQSNFRFFSFMESGGEASPDPSPRTLPSRRWVVFVVPRRIWDQLDATIQPELRKGPMHFQVKRTGAVSGPIGVGTEVWRTLHAFAMLGLIHELDPGASVCDGCGCHARLPCAGGCVFELDGLCSVCLVEICEATSARAAGKGTLQ